MFFRSKKASLTCLMALSLATFATLLNSSCKKDDDSLTDILVANDWKLVSVKIAGVGGPADDCDKDDKLSFHEDGTYNFDEGTVKCDPADPQTVVGTFKLDESAKTLEISYDESGSTVTETQTIKELTNSSMVLTIEIPLFGTIESTYEPY